MTTPEQTEYETKIGEYVESLSEDDRKIMLNGARNMMELYSMTSELDEVPEGIKDSFEVSSAIVKIYNL